MKPIRVFYSPLGGRFYASRSYVELSPGKFRVTGQKDDVTADIASAVIQHDIEFAVAERLGGETLHDGPGDEENPAFSQGVIDSYAGVGEIDKSYEEVWGDVIKDVT